MAFKKRKTRESTKRRRSLEKKVPQAPAAVRAGFLLLLVLILLSWVWQSWQKEETEADDAEVRQERCEYCTKLYPVPLSFGAYCSDRCDAAARAVTEVGALVYGQWTDQRHALYGRAYATLAIRSIKTNVEVCTLFTATRHARPTPYADAQRAVAGATGGVIANADGPPIEMLDASLYVLRADVGTTRPLTTDTLALGASKQSGKQARTAYVGIADFSMTAVAAKYDATKAADRHQPVEVEDMEGVPRLVTAAAAVAMKTVTRSGIGSAGASRSP